jgi:glycine/D-amino acid oxidase-like deaminating enzyme
MSSGSAPVAVLGAGIQGVCVALALAKRGIGVDLYDLNPLPMLGASLHSEGKLHLGFVYANDPHYSTPQVMLDGSLTFAPIIDYLTMHTLADLQNSTPFDYVVAANSLLDPDAVEEHFAGIAAAIAERGFDSRSDYLGRPLGQAYSRCTGEEMAGRYNRKSVSAVFKTAERAVPTSAVATLLRSAVANEKRIRFIPYTEVIAAQIEPARGVNLTIRTAGKMAARFHPVAVNCLWDGRLGVDASAGILPQRPWLFRYKATLHVRAPDAQALQLPSATLILGPYGDVVNFGGGDFYVSWYPRFKLGETDGLDGRQLHALLDGVDREAMSRDGIKAMAAYIPDMSSLLARSSVFEIGGGVIFAWGSTDVCDPSSELHQRFAIGVEHHGPYLSIDTGKYCTAPMFAMQAADLVSELLV